MGLSGFFPKPASVGVVDLADPGNGGTITATAQDTIVRLSSSAVETRTIADPATLGQRLTLFSEAIAGNVVVLASSVIDASSNNIVRFTSSNQTVWFMAVPKLGGGLRWQYMSSDSGSTAGSGTDNQLVRDSP